MLLSGKEEGNCLKESFSENENFINAEFLEPYTVDSPLENFITNTDS